MVLLSAIILLIGVIASWRIDRFQKAYFLLYLLFNGAVFGCFVTLDLLLFYIFFEFMLLPLYFLVGIWGGERREYAAIKFFLYTLLGSIFILIPMLGLYRSSYDPVETAVEIGMVEQGQLLSPTQEVKLREMASSGQIDEEQYVHTFNMLTLSNLQNYIPGSLLSIANEVAPTLMGYPARYVLFCCMFLGFLIKLPGVPFHTWLPDAHVEAPVAVSVVLAGVLLKIGGYGILRIVMGMFTPEVVHFSWWIGLIGVVSIVYGAYNALAMKDLKKMIAYSSISHMGFVLLGIASLTAEGINGAIYQMISHGILSAMLFLIVGVIYDRTHNRSIDNFRGLAVQMPYYTAVVTVAFFASLGLPGFSAFIAELMVFIGAFKGAIEYQSISVWMVVVAVISLVLTAGYFLWTLQRMFFNKLWLLKDEWNSALKDLTIREYIMFVPLVLLALTLGIFPQLILDIISPATEQFSAAIMQWVK
jgi:NADH-quinone oxidoreductase subunit M